MIVNDHYTTFKAVSVNYFAIDMNTLKQPVERSNQLLIVQFAECRMHYKLNRVAKPFWCGNN